MASRGYPSLTALLALLAIAGYQNRDKIAEMLRNAQGASGKAAGGQGGNADLGGILDQLGLGGKSAGGILSGGLGELIESFSKSGEAATAESWIGTGSNKPCSPAQLERAIGPDVVSVLTKQTGLSKDELLDRLCRDLPKAVDKFTPQGRIPVEADFPTA
jgi:uncharacterized protein YidB (DUF937 family)